MKKYLLAFGLFLAALSFTPVAAQHVSVSFNIGRQPAWGPVGYDYVSYYYLPDINCYYDVDHEMFYYPYRGQWVSARYLPYSYRDYDFYRMYKVVINDRRPWLYNRNHIRNYARYRGYRSQPVIRYSTDRRYYDSRRNDIRWYDDNRHTDRHDRYDNRYNDRYDRRDDNRYDRHDDNRYDRGRDNNRYDSRNENRPDRDYSNRERSYRSESSGSSRSMATVAPSPRSDSNRSSSRSASGEASSRSSSQSGSSRR